MATIRARRGRDGKVSFQAMVRLKGHPPQSATFTRKTDAVRWAEQIQSAIREGRHVSTPEAKKHTVAQMIDRYLEHVLPNKRSPHTRYAQNIQLKWWRTRLGNYLISDVTPDLIAQARDELAGGATLRGERRSDATVIRYMAALSHCFTIAKDTWGWAQDNPVRRRGMKPKEPRGRVRFLSRDERERLLEACRASRNKHLYPIVLLALITGMRRGEILGLTWDRVDFARNVVLIEDTKNNDRRAVPIVGPARQILQEQEARYRLKRQQDTNLVFPAPFRFGRDTKPVDIQSAWDMAIKRADIKDFRFHDLRHSAASELAMSGATLAEIAEVLGHRSLSVTQRYAHLTEGHTAGVLSRMVDKVFGPQQEMGELTNRT